MSFDGRIDVSILVELDFDRVKRLIRVNCDDKETGFFVKVLTIVF